MLHELNHLQLRQCQQAHKLFELVCVEVCKRHQQALLDLGQLIHQHNLTNDKQEQRHQLCHELRQVVYPKHEEECWLYHLLQLRHRLLLLVQRLNQQCHNQQLQPLQHQ